MTCKNITNHYVNLKPIIPESRCIYCNCFMYVTNLECEIFQLNQVINIYYKIAFLCINKKRLDGFTFVEIYFLDNTEKRKTFVIFRIRISNGLSS